MLLFADSGSTKTTWIAFQPQTKQKIYFDTLGINPVIHSKNQILGIISENNKLLAIANQISGIYFFGAGCSNNTRNQAIQATLYSIFTNATSFVVKEDSIAAGISICGNQKGIACILGTGSNSIYFDGLNWHISKAGIGYILGDEGSGAYFGKLLLRDFLYQLLPKELEQYLITTFNIDRDTIFKYVYKEPSPNRYLAQFAPVLSEFRATPYVQKLLRYGFSEFVSYHICYFEEYKSVPVGFVGSIAVNFKDELCKVLNENSITIGKFVKNPIEELVDFYTR